MSKRRVVITGLGIVSPLGIGVAENWRNILAGKSGITRVTHFDATGYPSMIAGEVKNFARSSKLAYLLRPAGIWNRSEAIGRK